MNLDSAIALPAPTAIDDTFARVVPHQDGKEVSDPNFDHQAMLRRVLLYLHLKVPPLTTCIAVSSSHKSLSTIGRTSAEGMRQCAAPAHMLAVASHED